MVGQQKLLKKLDTFTLQNFPKSSILLGEKGCGKHTYMKLIADKLGLDLFDITETISFEYILNMYQRTIPTIYYVDINTFTEKKQNIILKLLEEPPMSAYIILLVTNKSLVLDTILNRCIIFDFEKYDFETLKSFIESGDKQDLICSVLMTPGQIISSNTDNINNLYDVCLKIADKLNIAPLWNTLLVGNKINYKDSYDKFDIDVFFNMFSYVMFEEYRKNNNDKLIDYLNIGNKFKQRLDADKRLDKERLFQSFLIELWEAAR